MACSGWLWKCPPKASDSDKFRLGTRFLRAVGGSKERWQPRWFDLRQEESGEEGALWTLAYSKDGPGQTKGATRDRGASVGGGSAPSSKRTVTPAGFVELAEGCAVEITEPSEAMTEGGQLPPTEHVLRVTTPRRVWLVAASTEESALLWMARLQNAIATNTSVQLAATAAPAREGLVKQASFNERTRKVSVKQQHDAVSTHKGTFAYQAGTLPLDALSVFSAYPLRSSPFVCALVGSMVKSGAPPELTGAEQDEWLARHGDDGDDGVPAAVVSFLRKATFVFLERGEVVGEAGAAAEGVQVMLEGTISRSLLVHGAEHHLEDAEAGDVLGDVELVYNHQWLYTAVCTEPCTMLRFSSEAYAALLGTASFRWLRTLAQRRMLGMFAELFEGIPVFGSLAWERQTMAPPAKGKGASSVAQTPALATSGGAGAVPEAGSDSDDYYAKEDVRVGAQYYRAARLFKLAQFEAGATVIQQGAVSDSFYVLVHGSAKAVVADLKGGAGKHSFTYRPGDHFGERGLLNDRPTAASIIAVTPVITLCCDAENFKALIEMGGDDLMDSLENAENHEMARILERMPLFSGNKAICAELCQLLNFNTYEAGTVFQAQGAPVTKFAIIVNGQMDIVLESAGTPAFDLGDQADAEADADDAAHDEGAAAADGAAVEAGAAAGSRRPRGGVVIDTAHEPDVVAPAAVCFGSPSAFTFLATAPTVILETDVDNFRALMASNPRLADSFERDASLFRKSAIKTMKIADGIVNALLRNGRRRLSSNSSLSGSPMPSGRRLSAGSSAAGSPAVAARRALPEGEAVGEAGGEEAGNRAEGDDGSPESAEPADSN